MAAAALLVAGCGGGSESGEQSLEEVSDEVAEIQLEPGQWEITTEILEANALGMPAGMLDGMTKQKNKVRNCIRPEQAARPDPGFFAAQQNSNCTYHNWNMRGGKLTGTVSCEGGDMPGRMTIRMEGTYRPTEFENLSNVEMAGGGMDMKMKGRVRGKRLGECRT